MRYFTTLRLELHAPDDLSVYRLSEEICEKHRKAEDASAEIVEIECVPFASMDYWNLDLKRLELRHNEEQNFYKKTSADSVLTDTGLHS